MCMNHVMRTCLVKTTISDIFQLPETGVTGDATKFLLRIWFFKTTRLFIKEWTRHKPHLWVKIIFWPHPLSSFSFLAQSPGLLKLSREQVTGIQPWTNRVFSCHFLWSTWKVSQSSGHCWSHGFHCGIYPGKCCPQGGVTARSMVSRSGGFSSQRDRAWQLSLWQLHPCNRLWQHLSCTRWGLAECTRQEAQSLTFYRS